jgi:phenylacetate-CoA ligase
MLLLRDDRTRTECAALQRAHAALVHAVSHGTTDVRATLADKLAATLRTALRSPMYDNTIPAGVRARLSDDAPLSEAELTELLRRLPFLGKRDLAGYGQGAFTRQVGDFLHYYESSGTTGHPSAAPKALDDLIVNTINIGEMWGRILAPTDIALILINAPFAPAAYQFEKVLEYLEVMSFRPWVDNITGDYTRVLRLVEQLGANVFIGPPSRLLEMVQFAHRNGLPAPRFDRLLLMAEQTGPSFIRHLERLTGATAYVASYGSSETGTPAVTCEHRNLHLQPQSFLLELFDEHGARPVTGAADRGELVVTTLDIPARPLIRYRTGDLVEIDATPCPCGLASPVLRTLGRSQDLLLLAENGIRQNDLENALWAAELDGGVVFNYMLVARGNQVVFLVTTDGDGTPGWCDQLAARLRPLFGPVDLVVRPVATLPPLASLGQYLGWKMSRVLDLGDEQNWDRLPEPIRSVVRHTLDEVAAPGEHTLTG